MNIRLSDSLTISQFALSILIVIVTISIAYATMYTKIEYLEKYNENSITDHDILLVLKTKLEVIQQNTEEIKNKLDKHIENDK